jgi:hypothetical protein
MHASKPSLSFWMLERSVHSTCARLHIIAANKINFFRLAQSHSPLPRTCGSSSKGVHVHAGFRKCICKPCTGLHNCTQICNILVCFVYRLTGPTKKYLQSVTCKLGRQQAMEDEKDATLSRRKLVMGASALAAWIATGRAEEASAAIETAFAATPVPTMPAPTTAAQFIADEGKRLRGAILQGDVFNGALR